MALAAAVTAPWPLESKSQIESAIQHGDTHNMKAIDSRRLAYNDRIAALRESEYPQLGDIVYLDHAGTTLPSKSLIDRFSACMLSDLMGNPHSISAASSQSATLRVDDVRLRALRFFGADPNDFDLVFTANATAAIKLVGDCIRDASQEQNRDCWYGYHKDAHTSLVGLREVIAKDGNSRCFESDNELELFLESQSSSNLHSPPGGPDVHALLAYPAQSNMDGRRLSLSWIVQARQAHIATLLDAAALVSTSPLDLGDAETAPDFTVLSFYKIFGFPDLGALIVRKAAGDVLTKRRYFGGGTVEVVTALKEHWHIRKDSSLHEQLEDGTLPVHSIVALGCALDAHNELYRSMQDVAAHTTFLADRLYSGLRDLKHGNGSAVCIIYGDRHRESFGPTIAFNILNSIGVWASNFEVEKLAAVKKFHLRTGGVCNPGGIASALKLSPWDLQNNFSSGQRCGGDNDVRSGNPTGIMRLSLGAMSTTSDVDAFLNFMKEFFVDDEVQPRNREDDFCTNYTGFHVESLTVYPIKSCAGWRVPQGMRWPVRREGLAWDREWCLVHSGTREALSQKRYPRMALIKPAIDLERGLLAVTYKDPLGAVVGDELSVPLFSSPHAYVKPGGRASSIICGDQVSMCTYQSPAINAFFSKILGIPCELARFPASGSGPSARHAKPHLTGAPNLARPRTLLLSNESPLLVISRSSLNRLNETVTGKTPPGQPACIEVFRANIVLGEQPVSGEERPFVEDEWTQIQILPTGSETRPPVELDVLGPCRRCQMVCIDQATGVRSASGEPFVTLAKTRRRDGKVWFGMHSALSGAYEGMIQIGDRVRASAIRAEP